MQAFLIICYHHTYYSIKLLDYIILLSFCTCFCTFSPCLCGCPLGVRGTEDSFYRCECVWVCVYLCVSPVLDMHCLPPSACWDRLQTNMTLRNMENRWMDACFTLDVKPGAQVFKDWDVWRAFQNVSEFVRNTMRYANISSENSEQW